MRSVLCPLPYNRPLIPLTAAFILGIVAGSYVAGYAIMAWGVSIAGTAMVLLGLKQARPLIFVPLLLFTALGYLAIQPWLAPRLPAHHIAHFADQGSVWVEGVILDLPNIRGHRTRLHLAADYLETDTDGHAVNGKLRVNLYGQAPPLGPGDRVGFKSTLRPIRGFRNPGGFDYERYMAFQRIRVTAAAGAADLYFLSTPESNTPRQYIQGARHRIDKLIETTVAAPAGQVLRAVLVGNRQAIPAEWRDRFNRAGVSHVLAISGLHLSIVVGVTFLLWRHLAARSIRLLQHAWINRLAALLTLPPLLTYALLAGMSPATQRALVMAAIFLLALLIQREHDPLNTLCAAALAILLAHPPTLFRIAFQLSFAAVAAVMGGLHILSRRSSPPDVPPPLSPGRWLMQKIRTLFQVSLLAILGTLPLVMHYFNQAAPAGILANMLVVPLIGFVVVPSGLLALLLFLIHPGLGQALLALCGQIVSLTLYLITLIADWPLAAFKTFTPSIPEIACYYLAVGSAIFLWGTSKPPPSNNPMNPNARQPIPPQQRRFAAGILIASLLLALFNTGYWSYQRFGRMDLRVTVLDVGQGSAALLELPRGKVFLLDGGGFADNDIFDVGAFVVAPVLWRKKIHTIDKMILSHPDSDHLNGLLFIAEHFNVRQVWTNGEGVDTQGYRQFNKIIEHRRLHMPAYTDLPRTLSINGVTIELLYPPEDFQRYQEWQNWRTPNNNSLVLRLQHGNNSLLFPGDIESRAEFELVALHRGRLQSDVLLAPHHGSRSSSRPFFLEEVAPSIVVVSAGWTRRQYFPHPEVLAQYHQRGFRVYNTADHGAVRIVSDGRRLLVSSM